MRLRAVPGVAAVTAVGALLVFGLPWLVPGSSDPVVSLSWATGFDNRTAMVGMVLTVCAAFAVGLIAARGSVRSEHRRVIVDVPPKAERVDGRAVIAVMCVTAATAAALIWATGHVAAYQYGEMSYFLNRLAYTATGARPYIDFEFAYGPALLYAPYLAYRALAPLGGGPLPGYFLVLVFMELGAVAALAWIVDRLALDRRTRTWVFVAFSAPMLVNETLGLQYAFLRHVAPIALLVLLDERVRPLGEGPRADAKALGWATVTTIAGFALSIEVGLALFVASLVYLLVRAYHLRGHAAMPPGVYVLAIAGLAAALGNGAFESTTVLGSGWANFPFVPSLPQIALFLAAALGAVFVARKITAGPATSMPATFAFGVLATALLPGAMGRADTAHVFWYGLTAFLLVCTLVAARYPRALSVVLAVGALTFVTAHAFHLWIGYRYPIVWATASRPGMSREEAGRIARIAGYPRGVGKEAQRAARAMPAYDWRAVADLGPVAFPYGFSDDLGFRLADAGALTVNYLVAAPLSGPQLRASLDLVRSADRLMVPVESAVRIATRSRSVQRADRVAAARLLGAPFRELALWPWKPTVKRGVPDYVDGLDAAVAAEFAPVARYGPYTLFERVRRP